MAQVKVKQLTLMVLMVVRNNPATMINQVRRERNPASFMIQMTQIITLTIMIPTPHSIRTNMATWTLMTLAQIIAMIQANPAKMAILLISIISILT